MCRILLHTILPKLESPSKHQSKHMRKCIGDKLSQIAMSVARPPSFDIPILINVAHHLYQYTLCHTVPAADEHKVLSYICALELDLAH